MVENQGRTLLDLVRKVGRYPEDAFLFVREGLSFAADRIHGKESEPHRMLQHYLAANQIDWNDLIARYHAGNVPDSIVEAIDDAGGCDTLNRHIGGREVCWGLRDYALERWGMLARVVLQSWNITSTRDFGRIVFGFIDFDMMQREDRDSIDDFEDIYVFEEAFEQGHQRKRCRTMPDEER